MCAQEECRVWQFALPFGIEVVVNKITTPRGIGSSYKIAGIRKIMVCFFLEKASELIESIDSVVWVF